MKIDFHTHTIYSKHHLLSKFGLIDGLFHPAQMVKSAKKIGLTGICLTDHNFIHPKSVIKELTREFGILVVSGAEVNIGKKEYIILGCDEIPNSSDISEIAEYVKENNGLLIAPHPNDPLGRGFKNEFQYFDGVEVLNGFGSRYTGDTFGLGEVTGSDAHIPQMMGYSHTIIEGDTFDDVKYALKHGTSKPTGKPFPKSILMNYYLFKYYTWLKRYNHRNFFEGAKRFVRQE